MAYITKIDLGRQAKLRANDTAIFDGSFKIGGEMYLTKFNDLIDSENIYVAKWSPDGRLTPVLANNIGDNNNALALKYRGEWGSTSLLPFFQGDMVSHNGFLYVLNVTVLNTNTEPTENMTTPWSVIAVAGYKGEPGEDGKDGTDYEYVYLATSQLAIPVKPVSGVHYTPQQYQQDDFVPTLPNVWSDDGISVSEEKPYIWYMRRIKVDNIWQNFSDPKLFGMPGGIGEKGDTGNAGDTFIRRYALNGSTTIPPEVDRTVIAPPNWSLTMPNVSVGMYLWMIEGRVTATNTLVGQWSNPVRMSPIERETVDGETGPSMAYRGTWDATKQYGGNKYVVDVVAYLGKGYIARADRPVIPVGTVPNSSGGANYWNEFTENIDSVFTDFLFAYSAYIQDLTVGAIRTGVAPANVPSPELDGERFSVGEKPLSTQDPTYEFSKHSPRGYYPSGRIMWTITFIPEDSPITHNHKIYKNVGALIFYRDDYMSTVHSVLSSNQVWSWQHLPVTLVTSDISSFTSFSFPPERVENNKYKPGPSTDAYYYDAGDVTNENNDKFYEGFHTVANKGMGNFIPDGWYHITSQYNLALPDEENGGQGRFHTRFLRIKGGKITNQIWSVSGWDYWIDF